MRLVILLLALLSVSSANAKGDDLSDMLKNADGETPFRYVLCTLPESLPELRKCDVVARFSHIEDCERHKAFEAERMSYPFSSYCLP